MKNVPRLLRYLIVLLAGVALYFGGRAFLYWKLEQIVVDKIAEAQSRNISIQYGALRVDYWRGDLTIDSLDMKLMVSDTICRICGQVSRVQVAGISILPLLFRKELELANVKIQRPSVRYDNRYNIPDRKGKKPNSLKGVRLSNLQIDSANFEVVDSVTHTSKAQARASVAMKDFRIRFDGDESMKWSVGEVTLDGITATFRKALYNVTVAHASYSRKKKEFRLDSLQVTPSETKSTFAKKIGHQVDQFTCTLPLLAIDGLEIDSTGRPDVRASHIGMSFHMLVYRDKRYPLKHRKPRRMPVNFMRQLDFNFAVDSVTVYPSFVSYEEFPENGENTGRIFFNELKASIHTLSNDSSRGSTEMHVQSRFMDAGNLKAHFTFPLNGKKPYAVAGALTDFSMPQVNAMLVPVGNVKVESGKMHEMKFRFHYNSVKSDGELEVNYSDLKVLSLKKDDRRTPNKILSLLIGVFVKKDIDGRDSKDRRTGQIQWERDTQKGILNYWWKSVLSGIKSVYNLDMLTGNGDQKRGKPKK
jgi:hypothetical protein